MKFELTQRDNKKTHVHTGKIKLLSSTRGIDTNSTKRESFCSSLAQ